MMRMTKLPGPSFLSRTHLMEGQLRSKTKMCLGSSCWRWVRLTQRGLKKLGGSKHMKVGFLPILKKSNRSFKTSQDQESNSSVRYLSYKMMISYIQTICIHQSVSKTESLQQLVVLHQRKFPIFGLSCQRKMFHWLFASPEQTLTAVRGCISIGQEKQTAQTLVLNSRKIKCRSIKMEKHSQ